MPDLASVFGIFPKRQRAADRVSREAAEC